MSLFCRPITKARIRYFNHDESEAARGVVAWPMILNSSPAVTGCHLVTGPLTNLPNRVVTAEWIGYPQRALGIIVPLAIHEKSVVMRAWFQFDDRTPDAIRPFLQVDGLVFPIRKI